MTATAAPSDFVNVQLSADGVAAAGGHSLRVTAARMSYQFTAGAQVRVLTSEWAKILARHTLGGKKTFELVPATPAVPAAPTPATPVAATPAPSKSATDRAKLKELQAQEAAVETEIAKEGN